MLADTWAELATAANNNSTAVPGPRLKQKDFMKTNISI
jgi:hypothetical protein